MTKPTKSKRENFNKERNIERKEKMGNPYFKLRLNCLFSKSFFVASKIAPSIDDIFPSMLISFGKNSITLAFPASFL